MDQPIKHRETVLTERELAKCIASMNTYGIFDFVIKLLTEEDKAIMKVKFPKMKYFSVEYEATDDQDDAWDLLDERRAQVNYF